MIVTTGQVLKIEEWNKRKDIVTKYMRQQVHRVVNQRDLVVVGPEEVEIVEIRFNGKGWVSAKGDNITHVKVTLSQTVEHA